MTSPSRAETGQSRGKFSLVNSNHLVSTGARDILFSIALRPVSIRKDNKIRLAPFDNNRKMSETLWMMIGAGIGIGIVTGLYLWSRK